MRILLEQTPLATLQQTNTYNSPSNRIPRPLHFKCKHPQLKRFTKHRPRWRRKRILLPAEEQNSRTQTEHDRWQGEREPEPDIPFRVDHGDGPNQGANVDHAVEVEEDAGDGLGWVDDDSFAGF